MGNLKDNYTDQEWEYINYKIKNNKSIYPQILKNEVVDEKILLLLDEINFPLSIITLHQNVIRWFSEEKDLHGYIEKFYNNKYDYVVISNVFDSEINFEDGPFETYLQAEKALIIKLINIYKNILL